MSNIRSIPLLYYPIVKYKTSLLCSNIQVGGGGGAAGSNDIPGTQVLEEEDNN